MTFTGHAPGSPAYRRLIVGLFFAGIATFAQLYSPQAVLPQLSTALGISPASAALSVSAATLGLAAAVIPWSMVADRIGRVQAMAIGVLTATVLGLLAPLSVGMEMLLTLRLLEGVALGAVPAVALAYLSEEVSPRNAAAAAGSYIAGTTVGGLLGRIVSGIVGEQTGWREGMWTVAGLCAVAAVLFLWLTPKAQGFVPGRFRDDAGPGMLTRLLAPLRSGRQLALYAQGFLLLHGRFAGLLVKGWKRNRNRKENREIKKSARTNTGKVGRPRGGLAQAWGESVQLRENATPQVIMSARVTLAGHYIMHESWPKDQQKDAFILLHSH